MRKQHFRVVEPDDDARNTVCRSASAEFLAGYEQWAHFSKSLIELSKGELQELAFEEFE
ncbi:hypothetical protein [Dyella tabacisoli]|uniref:hypothetical protein n=1 Tax=Dyella tabacisoli TaxID=2282381 RepID=UPI0013B44EA1|nr:hypothetical protein [Dyella tabacisoli]